VLKIIMIEVTFRLIPENNQTIEDLEYFVLYKIVHKFIDNGYVIEDMDIINENDEKDDAELSLSHQKI
jgi:hypothetical protein